MATRKLTTPRSDVQRTAYGYCRVSTDQQADSGISLDEQRRKIEARCVEHGWHLDRVYVDAGVSGSTPLARRPEGSKLLRMVHAGDVVVWRARLVCSQCGSRDVDMVATGQRR